MQLHAGDGKNLRLLLLMVERYVQSETRFWYEALAESEGRVIWRVSAVIAPSMGLASRLHSLVP
jgi:hypothetical protein